MDGLVKRIRNSGGWIVVGALLVVVVMGGAGQPTDEPKDLIAKSLAIVDDNGEARWLMEVDDGATVFWSDGMPPEPSDSLW